MLKHCWLRFRRHTWGPWKMLEERYDWLSSWVEAARTRECENCGKLQGSLYCAPLGPWIKPRWK